MYKIVAYYRVCDEMSPTGRVEIPLSGSILTPQMVILGSTDLARIGESPNSERLALRWLKPVE